MGEAFRKSTKSAGLLRASWLAMLTNRGADVVYVLEEEEIMALAVETTAGSLVVVRWVKRPLANSEGMSRCCQRRRSFPSINFGIPANDSKV